MVSTPLGTPGVAGTADGVGNAARFYIPVGIAFDGSGNLYIADSYNHTIRRVAPGFIVTTVAGDPNQLGDLDGTGAAARFQYPQQLAWAGSRMLVADYWENSKLRAVTPDGVVTTAAGPAGFFVPLRNGDGQRGEPVCRRQREPHDS